MSTTSIRSALVPPGLAGRICLGRSNIPRFWASIWIDVLKGPLEASTKQRYLSALSRLYEAAERQRGADCLRDRMAGAIETLEALSKQQRSVGWHNQLAHARTRLANILTTLDTRPGEKPFPDGPDLYQSAESRRGTSVLNTVTFLQDAP